MKNQDFRYRLSTAVTHPALKTEVFFQMSFEDFEPIFGEPKVEWAAQGSRPLCRFLFHVHAPDSSHIRIHVTDFHSNTWEATRSVPELEDMMDIIGIGGSLQEFIAYFTTSIKSEGVRLCIGGNSDAGGADAKLIAQKSKGLPLIPIPLTKLTDTAASEAMSILSLGLFNGFTHMQNLLVQEQERSNKISAEKGKNESIQSQLVQYSKRQKLNRTNGSDKVDVSGPLPNTELQNSPDKPARDSASTRTIKRVVPARRRAKVRGVLLQNTEDDNNV